MIIIYMGTRKSKLKYNNKITRKISDKINHPIKITDRTGKTWNSK